MIKDKNNFRVLVVEDNPGDFMLVEEYLLDQIRQPIIVHAGDFKEAMSILSSEENSFDVILMDLSLPDKSGEYVVNEMLNRAPECPVIILTGFTDIDFSIQSIAGGIADYLLKDELNASSLYKSIVYCIERRKQIIELKESEKRFSTLFQLSPQPMWVYDPVSVRFIMANIAATELYGYTESEFLQMPAMDIKAAEDISVLDKSSGSELKKYEDYFKGRYKHAKKTGEEIDVDMYSSPIIINDKEYLSVIAIDVTEKILFEYKITRAIIKTQEDERYEVGAELHDNVCQLLASSLLTLGMLKSSLDKSGLDFFAKSKDNILLATQEIRNLSHRLAPVFFNDSTLEEAIDMLLHTFNVENKFKLTLHFDKAVSSYVLGKDLQLNLYRILQEQLSNILKYAQADTINVDIIIFKKRLTMQVSDNGQGFDVNKIKNGIGLANIKRRTELFKGKMTIVSSRGKGCQVVIEIPLLDKLIQKSA